MMPLDPGILFLNIHGNNTVSLHQTGDGKNAGAGRKRMLRCCFAPWMRYTSATHRHGLFQTPTNRPTRHQVSGEQVAHGFC